MIFLMLLKWASIFVFFCFFFRICIREQIIVLEIYVFSPGTSKLLRKYCWNHFQNIFFSQLMNFKNMDSQSEFQELEHVVAIFSLTNIITE